MCIYACVRVCMLMPLSLGMIERACSVNKDWNNDDTKTVVWTLSVQGGLAHSPVSCWADCSFQSNTGDDRGKSALPIRVLRKRKGGGCNRGREKKRGKG